MAAFCRSSGDSTIVAARPLGKSLLMKVSPVAVALIPISGSMREGNNWEPPQPGQIPSPVSGSPTGNAFPALFFVISTSFIVYLYFGYLFELIYVSKISVASLLGIANLFYIFLKNDYFLQNELNPFIHTWSLGVEEQFYILYPFLLFIIILLLKNFYQLKKLYFFLKILLVFVIIIF